MFLGEAEGERGQEDGVEAAAMGRSLPRSLLPAGAGWGAGSAGFEQRGWKMGRHQRKDEK